MSKVLFKLEKVKKYFPVNKSSIFSRQRLYVKAIEDVSLDIYEGETLGLVGESGCGKSTLGRVLLNLYNATDGKVFYYGRSIRQYTPSYFLKDAIKGGEDDEGIDLSRLKKEEMRRLRRDMQIIFQDPYSSLNPRLTVGQIILEGIRAHSDTLNIPQDQREDYILKLMEQCGLQGYMIHRYPHQFSGGQRQRIGIARALAVKPKFIVCDEAVSALDVSIQAQIINLFAGLSKDMGITYLFISHDLSVIRHVSDRIGVMYLGHIVELADSEEIYCNPLHPYTKSLLSVVPTIDEVKPKRITLEGDIPSNVFPPIGCKFCTRCPLATSYCEENMPEYREVSPNHFVRCHFFEKTKDL